MKVKYLFFLIICANTLMLAAQVDTLKLDDVVLSDVRLKRYSTNNTLRVLNDSIIQKNIGNTTQFLRFNTPVFFKENGYGMVSSPSFRGTTASQTAVIWNGININSRLNGQTDFNALPLNGFDQVTVKSGGGSSNFGTGAIGGSIHLNNKLRFNKHFTNRLRLGYGSFNRQLYNYQLKVGDYKWSVNTDIQYQTSDNNFKYLETNERNENGEYDNLSFNVNFGVFVSENHLLKFYHQTFKSDRNLSGTLVAPSVSKYEDDTNRNLLKWTYLNSKYTSELSLAYLSEDYKFFSNKDLDNFSFGKAKTFLARYNLDYKLSNASKVFGLLEYNTVKGDGSSFNPPSNTTFSTSIIYKHAFSNRFDLALKTRKEFNSEFKTPLVFGFDLKYNLTNKFTIHFNGSKDFRTPTFNDLYWQPGGNLNLTPETSYQLDLGQRFQTEYFTFNANVFVIDIKDMIQWLPDNSGVWSPVNKNHVQSKGIELGIKANYRKFEVTGNYSYTDSRDKTNDRQLIYVPFHRFSGSIAYNFKDITAYYQQLFNGEVSIIGNTLDAYYIGNLGIVYALNTKHIGTYKFGLVVNNLFNTYYENVALRPMPNRNFNFNITLNF